MRRSVLHGKHASSLATAVGQFGGRYATSNVPRVIGTSFATHTTTATTSTTSSTAAASVAAASPTGSQRAPNEVSVPSVDRPSHTVANGSSSQAKHKVGSNDFGEPNTMRQARNVKRIIDPENAARLRRAAALLLEKQTSNLSQPPPPAPPPPPSSLPTLTASTIRLPNTHTLPQQSQNDSSSPSISSVDTVLNGNRNNDGSGGGGIGGDKNASTMPRPSSLFGPLHHAKELIGEIRRGLVNYHTEKERASRIRGRTRLEQAEDALNAPNPLERGDQIYRSILKDLDSIETDTWYLSRDQREIIQLVLGAMARTTYGPIFRKHEAEIKAKWAFESVMQALLVTMPRRAGKTEVIALLIALFMRHVPNIKILVFAQSLRAASGESGMMSHVYRLMQDKFKISKVDTKNKECLFIRNGPNDIRKLFCYSGRATHK